MKRIFIAVTGLAMLVSCGEFEKENPYTIPEMENRIGLDEIAKMLSEIPLREENLEEVHDAVKSSSGNGYDEEYMMSDLFDSPGRGVGGSTAAKAGTYSVPLRELLREYIGSGRKSGIRDAEEYIRSLSESDIQIYWPWSEDWDGKTYPIITFDPGYGAESNYGYEIEPGPDGLVVRDSVFVDERVAASRPVWVVNRNDDSAFSPAELFIGGGSTKSSAETAGKSLTIKTFKMLRNYDSWFAGASEFFVKCGSADGWKISDENDMKNYSPAVTDFMISVKRKYVGKDVPFDVMLVSDFNDNLEKLAFLIVEDDGGTRTNWKCEASVKYKSKSYGFSIDIPYNEKDDIVWRGQLDAGYFRRQPQTAGRFGDVSVTFAVE